MNRIPLDRWVVVVTLDPQYDARGKSYVVAPHGDPIRYDEHVQLATLFDSEADARAMIARCKASDYFNSPIYQFSVAKVTLNVAPSGGMFLTAEEAP